MTAVSVRNFEEYGINVFSIKEENTWDL